MNKVVALRTKEHKTTDNGMGKRGWYVYFPVKSRIYWDGERWVNSQGHRMPKDWTPNAIGAYIDDSDAPQPASGG